MYLPVEQLHSRVDNLVAKFTKGGGTSYIDEAIVRDRDALELRPPGDPKRSVSLTWLAIHLINRYDQLGATTDLDEATLVDWEALDLCPQGHPDRAMSLNNSQVSILYNQLGGMDDLDEAIVLV